MKVVTGATMQEIDRRAIHEFGVPGLVLMENAGAGCVAAIVEMYGCQGGKRVVVVAGKGNNGGDGFVIARLLHEQGWHVATFVIARKDDIGGDARTNLERLRDGAVAYCPEPGMFGHYVTSLREADVIVDALLGTGLKSDVTGVYAEAISLMNDAGRPLVAVDIPSGVDAATGKMLGSAVRADLTVTFALAKCGHVLYPGVEFTGKLKVVDIGIPAGVTDAASGLDFLDAGTVRPLLRKRERNAHKGSYGHCLIVAGSTGKTGAAAMAANSAVRSGAGLVTLAVPASLGHILEVKTTEAMTLPLPDGDLGHLGGADQAFIDNALEGKSAVAVGPGLALHPETAQLVRRLVSTITQPLVLDADGLNAVAEESAVLLRKQSQTVVLTPHPGEMARLAGCSVTDVERDRIASAREFAERYGVHVVLKGARTIIAAPDGRMAINGSGNPGMASGGMGDVLTGILVALLAQGYEPFTACRIGVFLHGHAADMVAAEMGEVGMSAVDVQDRLPFAFKQLMT
ncbi:MAG: bifunctional ADP-dependent NAD(P)H-hydrate dehydratase/NAD(P)H-hydrate epimerase [Geobacter sp.]|nr:MAG: bifunctional ADP-dependent NAD(P)H-hydrate dehydratase/NAD(P)H-hydrate epimerase [Geobacter sp.]